MSDDTLHFSAPDGAYTPIALYFQDADSLEYVRVDSPSVHRRIDAILTLVLEMHTRELIGFKVKGFKNFYMKISNKCEAQLGREFIDLTEVLSTALSLLGDAIFEKSMKDARQAYEEAIEIASRDDVKIKTPLSFAS